MGIYVKKAQLQMGAFCRFLREEEELGHKTCSIRSVLARK